MTIQKLTLTLTATAALLVSLSTVHAARPAPGDCDDLATTIDAVDDFLDMQGVGYASLGDLLSTAILDSDLFIQLNGLIIMFSPDPENPISFSSPTKFLAATARCGLVPALIDHIND